MTIYDNYTHDTDDTEQQDLYYIHIAEGPEWEDSQGHTIITTEDGEWITDLDNDGHLIRRNPYEISEAVTRALNLENEPDLIPTGYTTGPTAPPNWTTTSTIWTFTA